MSTPAKSFKLEEARELLVQILESEREAKRKAPRRWIELRTLALRAVDIHHRSIKGDRVSLEDIVSLRKIKEEIEA